MNTPNEESLSFHPNTPTEEGVSTMNISHSVSESQQFIPPYLPEDKRPAFFSLPQFVNWKVGKLPYCYKRKQVIDPHDPSNWMTYDEAVKSGHPYGFVFDKNCEYGVIDLDKCYDPMTFLYRTSKVIEIVCALNECGPVAWEFSQSGRGLHFVGRVDHDKCGRHGHKMGGWAEQYSGSNRFIAFGPSGWQGSGNADITSVITTYWPEDSRNDSTAIDAASSGPVPEYTGPKDDDALIAKMVSAKESAAVGFGDVASLPDLWNANAEVLGKHFPPMNDRDPYDRSSADMALATKLAFWCGKDVDRMMRIMRQSALVRTKWTDHRNYLRDTCLKAASGCSKVYDRIETVGAVGVDEEECANALYLMNPSDSHAAQLVAAKHRDTIRYAHDTGTWFVWNGTRWIRDKEGVFVLGKIRQWADAVRGPCSLEGRVTDSNWKKIGDKHHLESIRALLKTDTSLQTTSTVFDANTMMAATPSYALDLRTGETLPHDSKHLMSRSVIVDPSETADCPLWIKTLNDVFAGDQDTIHYMRKVFAYALTGETKFQHFWIAYGPGGNGKGVVLGTIMDIMGSYWVAPAGHVFTQAKTEKHEEYISALIGARGGLTTELPSNRYLNTTDLKAISGDDKITGRGLIKDRPDYIKLHVKLIASSNHYPKIDVVNAAIKRRLVFVPFVQTFKDDDPDLKTRLTAEHPAILRWILDALPMLWAEGLEKPQVIADATNAYFRHADTISGWLSESCEKIPGEMSVSREEAFRDYQWWCHNNDFAPIPRNEFHDQMEQHGYQRRNTRNLRCFVGLKIKRFSDVPSDRNMPGFSHHAPYLQPNNGTVN